MEQKVAALLSMALGVITDRLLTIAALAMTFALATWIMNDPNWVRFSVFACFNASVFLPILFKERKNEQAVSVVQNRPAYGEEP
jgi:uncharacterized membrane protein